jgi:hypothetical protein
MGDVRDKTLPLHCNVRPVGAAFWNVLKATPDI